MSSADTFSVQYEFSADSISDAEQIADDIALEQTAELPLEAVPPELRYLIGKPTHLSQLSDHRFSCSVIYSAEVVGNDILQFLNVMFGNVSIKPNIKITDFDLGACANLFPGPAYGIDGIRNLLSAQSRALSCTALKPVGSSPEALADIASKATLGGIDIIKDDHGLANQHAATFQDRVDRCVQSIRDAEQISGKKTLYFPNITSRFEELMQRAELAKELGADGLLISPQLTGLSALATLAESSLDLPVMAHPAFSGPYTINQNSGISPDIYFGKLWRALGANSVIYPNSGGRFSYSIEECQSINARCRESFKNFKPIFPVPGGGINRDSVSDWKKRYGNDTIFLIGGSLYLHPDGMEAAVREFQESIENGSL
jgi:ribulose-bisphosphate carboxylase large chain